MNVSPVAFGVQDHPALEVPMARLIVLVKFKHAQRGNNVCAGRGNHRKAFCRIEPDRCPVGAEGDARLARGRLTSSIAGTRCSEVAQQIAALKLGMLGLYEYCLWA